MKNIRYVILISLVCFAVTDIKAQADTLKQKKFSIAWEPLFIFDGGAGIDFEMRLRKTDNWLNLRLTGYGISNHDSDKDYYVVNSGFQRFRNYSGFGIQLMYKNFFLPDIFWGGGLGYNYYDVDYYAETYVPFVEDGMTFYKFYEGERSQYFNKVYPFLSLGVRSSSHKYIFVEAYITAGYSYSFYDEQRKAYNKNFLGFGHRGVAMTLGARVGCLF